MNTLHEVTGPRPALVGRNHRHEGAPQSSPFGLLARFISVSRAMAPRGSSGAVSRIELSTAAKATRPCSRRSRKRRSASRQVFQPDFRYTSARE